MQSNDTARRILLRNTILHWKEYKTNSLNQWKQSIIIDAKSTHLQLKITLKHWHEWSTHKYHNKNTIKYKNAINATKIVKTQRCIKYWKYVIQAIYQIQKQHIKASAYYNIKQQRKCILNWKQISNKNIILRSKLYQFTNEIYFKILQNCFNQWRKQQILQHKSIKITILLNSYANRLYLVHCFDHWLSQFMNINKNNDTALRFYECVMKRKMLNAFQTNIEYNKQCQNKLKQIVSIRSNPENVNKNELQMAYILWKDKTKQTQLIKNNINSEIKRDVLLLWQKNTVKQQRLKYFENKIKYKHVKLAIQRIFNEWKWNICVNQESELFLLSNYLKYWYEISKKNNNINSKYIILKQWIDIKLLHNIWLNWYLKTLENIELNEQKEIAINFYNNNSQTIIFYKWKEFVINHKKEKKLIKKIKNICKKSMKRRVFNHWYSLYFEHLFERQSHEIAMKYLMKKYIQCWNENMKFSKIKRFNNYKAKLYNVRTYFNKWLIAFEPFKIGFEYEKQITMSIKPYIDSIRHKNILFRKFRTWYIATVKKQRKRRKRIKAKKFRNKQIKRKAFIKWKLFVYKSQEIYCWNKGIVLGIVDNIPEYKEKEIDVDETLNNIELSLRDLLRQKLEFKQKCKQFIKMKELQNNDVKKCSLKMEINNYLKHKQQRKQQIYSILSGINSLYKNVQQHQYCG